MGGRHHGTEHTLGKFAGDTKLEEAVAAPQGCTASERDLEGL